MPDLCVRNWEQVRLARDRRILDDVNADLVRKMSNGVIVLGCGDGYRDPEATQYLFGFLPAGEQPPVVHSIKRNGGALILAPNSPLVKSGRTADLDLIDDIADAHERLGIRHMIIKVHAPCLKAYDNAVDFDQSMIMLVKAKQRLKLIFPQLSVVKLVDIDPGPHGGKKKTYKLCRTKMLDYGYPVSALDALHDIYPERATLINPTVAFA